MNQRDASPQGSGGAPSRALGWRSAGFLFLAAWLATSPALGAEFALVVGVNHCPAFRLPDGSRPPALRGAELDAEAIAQALVDECGFNAEHIELLKGERANRAKIEQAFQQMAARLRADDRFVFYFAGHGTQLPDRLPYDESDRLDEALCPADATGEGENLVADDELGQWLDALPARRITVLLDCCHAGTGTKAPDEELAARFLPLAGGGLPGSKPGAAWRELAGTAKTLDRQVAALFACRAEQQAYERRFPGVPGGVRRGQFTHFFLEGLGQGRADEDGDGNLTNEEMLAYVERRLDESFNRARPPAERQQPLLEAPLAGARLFFGR